MHKLRSNGSMNKYLRRGDLPCLAFQQVDPRPPQFAVGRSTESSGTRAMPPHRQPRSPLLLDLSPKREVRSNPTLRQTSYVYPTTPIIVEHLFWPSLRQKQLRVCSLVHNLYTTPNNYRAPAFGPPPHFFVGCTLARRWSQQETSDLPPGSNIKQYIFYLPLLAP